MKKSKIIATFLMASLLLTFGCEDSVKEETEYYGPNGYPVHNPSLWICWFPGWHGYTTRTVYVHHTSSGYYTRSYSPPPSSSYTSRGGWGSSSHYSGS
jgi:hypothetical protein